MQSAICTSAYDTMSFSASLWLDLRPPARMMLDSLSPTRVRYVVVLVTMLVSVLLYLDRFCLSFAETFIKEDLGLTRTQTGWLFGAFFLSYGLAQVPSGWLTDRWGGRLMLTIYVLAWSLFTGWTGLVAG